MPRSLVSLIPSVAGQLTAEGEEAGDGPGFRQQ